ncbi:MAG TPA: twin-arginine translocase TatA/TatE family subunit [Kofleriaceae bacterium]|nr:twin-arginine translocase TatA/TatE family subunit [Kofleriaceae bacterium]
MFGLGAPELFLIFLIALLVFGAGKLPQIGDALGRGIKNFKRSASGDTEIEVNERASLSTGDKKRLPKDNQDRFEFAGDGARKGADADDAEVMAHRPAAATTKDG